MLAEHFSVEVSLASAQTDRVMHYAPTADAKARVWLLYTGQHYDPLVGPDAARTFAAGDAEPDAHAARGAAALQATVTSPPPACCFHSLPVPRLFHALLASSLISSRPVCRLRRSSASRRRGERAARRRRRSRRITRRRSSR